MGGKWTTCRQIALDTLKAVETILEKPLPPPRQLPILGSHESPNQTINLMNQQQQELKKYLPPSELQTKQIEHLQSNYGLEAISIVAKSSPAEQKPLSKTIPICQAEIKHMIKNEHALTPTDILARRCRLALKLKLFKLLLFGFLLAGWLACLRRLGPVGRTHKSY